MTTILIASIFIGIVAFVILRMFWLWFFRINETIDLLKEIRDNSKK